MNILTVVSDLGRGGVQRTAVNFAVSFRVAGHASFVLAVNDLGPRLEDLNKSDVQVFRSLDQLNNLPSLDLIFVHSLGVSASMVRSLRLKFSNAKLVEKNVFSRPSAWDWDLDCSFQMTSTCLERYRRFGGQAPAAVIPNPVKVENFFHSAAERDEFREQMNVPPDSICLGRVGQPFTYKWSPLLISAFNRLSAEFDCVWLILVGPPKEVVAQARRSKYSHRIKALDANLRDSELRKVYASTDIFVHSAAQGESFGNVLMEAMLCEVPIVTLSTPWADNSQSELVLSAQSGFVAKSPSSWQRDVSRLIGNPTMRWEMGRRGREFVLGGFDAETTAKQALSIVAEPNGELAAVNVTLPNGGHSKSLAQVRAWFWQLLALVAPKVVFGAWRWLPSKLVDRISH